MIIRNHSVYPWISLNETELRFRCHRCKETTPVSEEAAISGIARDEAIDFAEKHRKCVDITESSN